MRKFAISFAPPHVVKFCSSSSCMAKAHLLFAVVSRHPYPYLLTLPSSKKSSNNNTRELPEEQNQIKLEIYYLMLRASVHTLCLKISLKCLHCKKNYLLCFLLPIIITSLLKYFCSMQENYKNKVRRESSNWKYK